MPSTPPLFDAQPHTGLATLDGGGMTLRVEALTLLITGIGDREEVMVYDLEGRPVYRGTDRHLPCPPPASTWYAARAKRRKWGEMTPSSQVAEVTQLSMSLWFEMQFNINSDISSNIITITI